MDNCDSQGGLTFEVFREVGLGHVVVDFSAFVCWNVGTRVLALVHELSEERIDLSVDSLSIQCVLHLFYLYH